MVVGARDRGSARRVVLGVGSNLGDREAQLRAAVGAWGDEVTAVSDVFETAPVGGPDQGPFLNLVLVLRTATSAAEVLARGQALEAAAGRVRIERWVPRPLDVDGRWIDGETHDRAELTVPHPRMFERAFVTVPLADFAPDLVAGRDVPTDQEVRRLGPLGSTSPAAAEEDVPRGVG
ncbi:2-amino-4-hydroxy-6-hydroxymethyldihydropteridinediphosphokinase [soil metagenome]